MSDLVNNSTCCICIVSFSLPKESEAIIVLSRADERFFQDLKSATAWNFDFSLFKEGEADAILVSRSTEQTWTRSTAVRTYLQPGSYVVHVRLERCSVQEEVSPLILQAHLFINLHFVTLIVCRSGRTSIVYHPVKDAS